MRIHVVNPSRSKGGKVAKPKKRRTTPAAPAAKPKRRKRRHNPEPIVMVNPQRRRRRRPNPEGEGLRGRLFADAPSGRSIGFALLADLVMGMAAKRFGDTWGTGIMGQAATSPYGGQAWSIKTYAVAGIALYVARRFIVRPRFGEQAAKDFMHAGLTQLARRFAYTELLARSQWAQDTFGNTGEFPINPVVMDDPSGQRWLQTTDGGWYAMQGLVRAGPMGALVQAGPMGGGLVPGAPLVPALPIDRSLNPGNVASQGGRYGRVRTNWGPLRAA